MTTRKRPARHTHDGWVLTTPAGNIVPDTFATTKQEAEHKAYDYLSKTRSWAASPEYWKEWDKFVAERVRRHWTVERAWVTWDTV